MNFFRLLLLLLVALTLPALVAAEVRENAKFQTNDFIQVDKRLVERPWRQVPFDQSRFSYSPQQLEALWPQLMRGLKFPYPSAAYLEERYARYPALAVELRNPGADPEALSQEALEVWALFFRGDYQEAFRLGHEYGGLSRIPAIMSEIVYATYLTEMQHERNVLLQDAANWIAHYAHIFNHGASDSAFHDDYVMIRVVYAYAMSRVLDDAPVPAVLASGVGFKVMEAVDEMLAVDPDHPLALALNASIDAGVIRRIGKTVGKVALQTDAGDTKERFAGVLEQVDDMAILYYEYANSLLYIDKGRGDEVNRALKTLATAARVEPVFAMEELDRLYALKRMSEVYAFAESRKPFRKFDKAREKYFRDSGVNMYSIWMPPFKYNG